MSTLIIAILGIASFNVIATTRFSIASSGTIAPFAEGDVKVYDFTNSTSLAPWWRLKLGNEANLTLTSSGLDFCGNWGFLYLPETFGNKSALIESDSYDSGATFGVGFIEDISTRRSWRIQWSGENSRLQFVYSNDSYYSDNLQFIYSSFLENRELHYDILFTTSPKKIAAEFLNSSSIKYFLELNDGRAIIGYYSTPIFVSQPEYAFLYFSHAKHVVVSRLYLAERLDHVLCGKNKTLVKEEPWYSLNCSIAGNLFYGFHAVMQGETMSCGLTTADPNLISQTLEFLKSHEFNAVKLQLKWKAIMPEMNIFDNEKLTWIRDFVKLANSYGHHVLLGMQFYKLDFSFQGEMNDEWLNFVMVNETLRKAFIETWVQVATAVHDLSVSYELINEPDVAESEGEAGFDKLVTFTEDLVGAIRNIDTLNMIYVNIYQWQDMHYLWATKNVVFNFSNCGFSLHIYPIKKVWKMPYLGYDERLVNWLEMQSLPIIVSEAPLTSLDPVISWGSTWWNPYEWQPAWCNAMEFALSFKSLKGLIFTPYTVTYANGTYTRMDVLVQLLGLFNSYR
jgi:hypothetical protein